MCAKSQAPSSFQVTLKLSLSVLILLKINIVTAVIKIQRYDTQTVAENGLAELSSTKARYVRIDSYELPEKQ